MSDPDLSAQATAVWRLTQSMMKAANSGAPHPVVGAHAERVAKAARTLWQMCESLDGEAQRVTVDTTMPDAVERLDSEFYGDHVEGTLPDEIPSEWLDE